MKHDRKTPAEALVQDGVHVCANSWQERVVVKKGNILENTVIVTSYLSDLSRNGGQDVSTLLIAGVRHFVCARISTLTAQHHPRKK